MSPLSKESWLLPEINLAYVYKALAILKSIHNIIIEILNIESLWCWLREKCGLNLWEAILEKLNWNVSFILTLNLTGKQ